ncbi:MAG: sensor domain-containing diguanylate cyclase [Janthinobacterium lividum]
MLRLDLVGLLAALAISVLLLARLQDSRNLFLQSINAVQEGYIVQNRAGVILLCNAGAEHLLGGLPGKLTGHSAVRPEWSFLKENGDEFPQTQHPSRLALETGKPQEAVILGIRRSEAGVVWFSMKAAPVFHTGQKTPYAAVLTFTDITAKKKIEEDLQKEREFQQALQESLQSGIVACDADGILTFFNQAARDFHGLPEEPLPPEEWTNHFDLYQPDGITPLPTSEIPLFRAFQGEIVRDAEIVIAPKDSPPRTLTASGQAIYSSQGRKLGAVVAMHDMTVRRRIEQELSRLAAIVESSEDAIFAMTLDGTLVSWNEGANRLYGYAEWEVIGQHVSILVPKGEISPLDAVIPRLVRGESIEPIEMERQRQDGGVFNMALTFSPIHDQKGEVIGLSCISRDITVRRKAEDALRESETRLRSLADAAFEGIAVSRDGMLVDANPAFLTLYGYETEEQVVGMRAEDFVVPQAHTYVYQKVISGTEETYEALCLRRDGTTFQAEIRGRKVLWDGLPARVTAVRDVTERKAMEEALRAVMSSAPIILFAADASGTITLSEGTGLSALGLAPGEADGQSAFDLGNSDPVLQGSIRRALAGETISCDMRTGSHCLHTDLRPQRDINENVTGIIGVCFDITERAQSEERFRVLFEQSSDAHLFFNDTGIIDCNPAALTMMRCDDKTQLLGTHPARLSPLYQQDGRLSVEKGEEMCVLARENGSHHFEWTRLAMDGTEFPVDITLTQVMLNEEPVMFSVWHDLTERKLAEQQIRDYTILLELQKSQLEATNRELEALATTDGLTGLKNHRTFQEKLAEEHARGLRYHQPLSLLLLDVDQFKSYNDSYGHPAGDAVLVQVAEVLSGTARDTDVVARYGGEEFVVILPQTDEEGAVAIAERIRIAIADSDWKQRPITVSLGVCTLSLDTPTPSVMVSYADKALYHSKSQGRNRVSHSNPADRQAQLLSYQS